MKDRYNIRRKEVDALNREYCFKSKVDAWLVVLVVLMGLGISAISLLDADAGSWIAALVTVTICALVLSMLYSIHYVVSGTQLKIFYFRKISSSYDLRELRSLRPTHNPLSAPAASLDRLELKFTRYRDVLISPKDKAGFMALVKAINPEVRIEENLKSRS